MFLFHSFVRSLCCVMVLLQSMEILLHFIHLFISNPEVFSVAQSVQSRPCGLSEVMYKLQQESCVKVSLHPNRGSALSTHSVQVYVYIQQLPSWCTDTRGHGATRTVPSKLAPLRHALGFVLSFTVRKMALTPGLTASEDAVCSQNPQI